MYWFEYGLHPKYSIKNIDDSSYIKSHLWTYCLACLNSALYGKNNPFVSRMFTCSQWNMNRMTWIPPTTPLQNWNVFNIAMSKGLIHVLLRGFFFTVSHPHPPPPLSLYPASRDIQHSAELSNCAEEWGSRIALVSTWDTLGVLGLNCN